MMNFINISEIQPENYFCIFKFLNCVQNEKWSYIIPKEYSS